MESQKQNTTVKDQIITSETKKIFGGCVICPVYEAKHTYDEIAQGCKCGRCGTDLSKELF